MNQIMIQERFLPEIYKKYVVWDAYDAALRIISTEGDSGGCVGARPDELRSSSL